MVWWLSVARAELPKLVVITDWSLGDLLQRLDDVLQAGPGIAVQHRHPEVTTAAFYAEALHISAICARHHAALFINGRLEIALALHAHLHLPVRAMTAATARKFLPADRLISIAVHDELEARDATGADFALVSPVFAAGSKTGDSRVPLGLDGFARLAAALPCPAYALGGIGPTRRVPLAAGHACISSVLRSTEPRAAALSMLGGR